MAEGLSVEKESPKEYTLRKAVAEDMLALRPLQAASWMATYPSDENGVPYEWVKERTDKWTLPERMAESVGILQKVIDDPAQFYRLAEQNGEVVGFVHCLTNEDETKELEAIYTLPKTFGTGLGPQLMDIAMEWVGDTPTTLKVADYNNRAIRFYEKYGFKKVDGSEALYADKIPMIVMRRG